MLQWKVEVTNKKYFYKILIFYSAGLQIAILRFFIF